jgi:peptidylprolyl isomerase
MKRAESGDMVKVHYTGRLEDGTVFDSSTGRDPLEFTIGQGKLLKAFENAVTGMSAGEKTTVKILYIDAYGAHMGQLVKKVPRDKFPGMIKLEIGFPLSMRQQDGGMLDMVITEISEDSVTLDGNHRLAGKDLEFEIELLEIS